MLIKKMSSEVRHFKTWAIDKGYFKGRSEKESGKG